MQALLVAKWPTELQYHSKSCIRQLAHLLPDQAAAQAKAAPVTFQKHDLQSHLQGRHAAHLLLHPRIRSMPCNACAMSSCHRVSNLLAHVVSQADAAQFLPKCVTGTLCSSTKCSFSSMPWNALRCLSLSSLLATHGLPASNSSVL